MNRVKLSILSLAAALPAASVLIGSATGPNMIANGDFSAGVAGWDDFSGNPQADNGTLKITNDYKGTGNSYYSGWYCLPVVPGVEYKASIDYFVPETALDNTSAGLALHYYASSDCSGGNLLTGGGSDNGGYNDSQRGQWLPFNIVSEAPAAANSVRMRVSATKEPQPSDSSMPEDHVVYFDNAYFGLNTPDVIELPDPNEGDPPADPGDGPGDPPQEPDPAQDPSNDPQVEDPAGDPEVPGDNQQPGGPAEKPKDDPKTPWYPPQFDEPLTVPGDPIRDPQPKPGNAGGSTVDQPKHETPDPVVQDTPKVDEPTQPEAPVTIERVEAPADTFIPLPPATGNSGAADGAGANLIAAIGGMLALLGGAGLASLYAKARLKN